ncbi:hypothetical protein Hdeb2414_s0022g00613781 [Helianthus debilis subsp. tardiflorus]
MHFFLQRFKLGRPSSIIRLLIATVMHSVSSTSLILLNGVMIWGEIRGNQWASQG